MPKISRTGFTIVELLIVIVVIGVLATIVVVTYRGMKIRAYNVSAYSELKTWSNLFTTYYSIEGKYPQVGDGGYCLGYGFPKGDGGVARCRNYKSSSNSYIESDNADLMSALGKYGKVPSTKKSPVGQTVGPYVVFSTNSVTGKRKIELTAVINGVSGECPSGTEEGWAGSDNRLLCEIAFRP